MYFWLTKPVEGSMKTWGVERHQRRGLNTPSPQIEHWIWTWWNFSLLKAFSVFLNFQINHTQNSSWAWEIVCIWTIPTVTTVHQSCFSPQCRQRTISECRIFYKQKFWVDFWNDSSVNERLIRWARRVFWMELNLSWGLTTHTHIHHLQLLNT